LSESDATELGGVCVQAEQNNAKEQIIPNATFLICMEEPFRVKIEARL